MDPLSPQHRSRLMARIHSKDTGPELQVRRALWQQGFRYRLHPKLLAGTPDLWFARLQTAVFIHGCFWHGHAQCMLYRLPRTHTEHWRQKVERNQTRDERDQFRLMATGLRVVIVWECALRTDANKTLQLLQDFLRSHPPPATLLEIQAQQGKVKAVQQMGRWEER